MSLCEGIKSSSSSESFINSLDPLFIDKHGAIGSDAFALLLLFIDKPGAIGRDEFVLFMVRVGAIGSDAFVLLLFNERVGAIGSDAGDTEKNDFATGWVRVFTDKVGAMGKDARRVLWYGCIALSIKDFVNMQSCNSSSIELYDLELSNPAGSNGFVFVWVFCL